MARPNDLEFRVLGMLEVWRNGEPVLAGRGAKLNVLVALLLSANETISADALAEIAWGGRQPRNPAAALQSVMWRLRQLLGEGVIETVVGGYRLRADGRSLDLLRFDALVSAAADAATDADAEAMLLEAISLWRGTPLANVDSVVLQREAVPRLEDRYLRACELWAGVCLRLARPGVVAERLGPLVAAHPFRETLAEQLMLALYGSGRQADALAVYDLVRRALHDELGLDPSSALQDAHLRILRASVDEPGKDTDDAADHKRPRWAGREPVPGRLIGRDAAQKTLTEAVASHRAVTVVGAAGVGKTELTLQTAKRLAVRFADGAAVAELGTLPAQATDDMKAVSGVILAAVGAQADAEQPAWEALLEELRPRNLLLVIDNAEHVFLACSRVVDLIMRSCAEVRVVATSRRPLGLGAERVVALEPLEPGDAAELLLLRASERGSDDELATQDAEVTRLCELIDGLPLALELAAARLRTMPLRALIDRIVTRPDLLTSEGRPALPHQRGLLTTLQWSYGLLTGPGRVLLTRLAVFAGIFSLEDAENVCGYPPLADNDAAGLLSGLVDNSLVQTVSDGGRYGYRLLVPIRDFAIGQAPSDDLNVARARHLRYLRTEAEQINSAGEQRHELIIKRLQDRYPEILAALEWALSDDGANRDTEDAVRLLLAAEPAWRRVPGASLIALGQAQRALERAAALPEGVAGDLTLLTGVLSYQAADFDAAAPCFEQVRRLLNEREPRYRRQRATALAGLAAIAYARVQPDAAALVRQAADDARRTGDNETTAFRLAVAAGQLAVLGHHDEALSYIEEAGQAIDGDRALRQRFLSRRAYVYLRLDRYTEALEDVDEVLADQAHIMSVDLTEATLIRAWAFTRQGRYDAARPVLNESMRLAQEIQAPTLLPDIGLGLAVTEAGAGDTRQAIQHLREVFQWTLPRSMDIDIMGALHVAVVLSARTGQPNAALLAATVRGCRLHGGLSSWPIATRDYAAVEKQLGAGPDTIRPGSLHDVIISTGKRVLNCLTASNRVHTASAG